MGGGGRREKRGQGMGEHSIHVVCGAGMHNVLGLGWGWVGWSWVGWGGVCAVSNVYKNNSYSVPIVVCRCEPPSKEPDS